MDNVVKMEIIRIDESNPLPEYKTHDAAAMDVYACLEEDYILSPKQQGIIPLGIKINIPEGYYVELTGRSGLAYSCGIMPFVGTIDHGFLDQIKFICWNMSNKNFTIKNGDRIAQIILHKKENISWVEVDKFSDGYDRKGGFGSTSI